MGGDTDDEGARPLDVQGLDASSTGFEFVDLGAVPEVAARLVAARQGIAERRLVDELVGELGLVDVRHNERRLLGRLVWSARGRRMIELRDGAWVPGPAAPAGIPQLAGRTLDDLASQAGELKAFDTSEDALFRAFLAELVGEGERAARIVAIVAGAAIALARRRGDLDYDRGGQARLGIDADG
ncbi:hypothetical protein [Miltoncostaea marina]|uniref:hypothetical protein n=1 Tax=Miltoncostaea marina TaxID=2843215 RepID=UPI001C3C79BA|nr:hypothetical protein [Miltoncostaea marina]